MSSPFFQYTNSNGSCDGVDLRELVREFGSPVYVYSAAEIRQRCSQFSAGLAAQKHLLCYAVKANSNLAILDLLRQQGCGADVVSGGEIERALRVGMDPKNIVFSGVGKRQEEIEFACRVDVKTFNVETAFEWRELSRQGSQLGRKIPVSIRINPDISAATHPKIATGLYDNKFGVPEDEAFALLADSALMQHLKFVGFSCHVGSQILDVSVTETVVRRMVSLNERAKKLGLSPEFLDLGGGFGISYDGRPAPDIADFCAAIIRNLPKDFQQTIVLEPGRSLVARSGVLLGTVLGRKKTPRKDFIIVDAAMNDLIRPTLYDAHHETRFLMSDERSKLPCVLSNVVGPVCETGDYLAVNRSLPQADAGDVMIIEDAGAYGMSMSSQYNTRPRAAEVLVDAGNAKLIRRRETIDDLLATEVFP
jgi:diaminopimelate decarboxylase